MKLILPLGTEEPSEGFQTRLPWLDLHFRMTSVAKEGRKVRSMGGSRQQTIKGLVCSSAKAGCEDGEIWWRETRQYLGIGEE